ncbi:MAG: 50S ribosomal protein L6 [Bdellovibrionales bacterium]|nr:50S ribosomal protein L6 [Bdellovibrionales bacterium]
MSRIGRAPVFFSNPVQVTVKGSEVVVKGAKASQIIKLRPEVQAKVEEGKILFTRANDTKKVKALHGLYRALVQNAVTGVSTGWSKTLEMNGVGYRGAVKGKVLELNLGFSHPINYDIPDGIEIKVEKQTTVIISGSSRELVGQVAAEIRGFRPPEPYLGKGVKYSDEHIRKKAGKAGAK